LFLFEIIKAEYDLSPKSLLHSLTLVFQALVVDNIELLLPLKTIHSKCTTKLHQTTR